MDRSQLCTRDEWYDPLAEDLQGLPPFASITTLTWFSRAGAIDMRRAIVRTIHCGMNRLKVLLRRL
jgi:hypothetical protein